MLLDGTDCVIVEEMVLLFGKILWFYTTFAAWWHLLNFLVLYIVVLRSESFVGKISKDIYYPTS